MLTIPLKSHKCYLYFCMKMVLKDPVLAEIFSIIILGQSFSKNFDFFFFFFFFEGQYPIKLWKCHQWENMTFYKRQKMLS